MIEVAKSKEQLNLLFICWGSPICDSSNFDRVHADLSVSNDDAKIFGLVLVEGTLVQVKVQLIFTENLHYTTNLCMMFSKGFGENEDVIDINNDLAVVDFDPEYFVHCLKGSGRIR